MRLAVMQPYFFPYIGYFQLVNAVDTFIIYDNIQYTKKGWINRNRILNNQKEALITLSIQKDSDYLNVCERRIAKEFNRSKLLGRIRGAYLRAPFFKDTYPLLEEIIQNDESNLFDYLHNSLLLLFNHLGIQSKVIVSSSVDIDHSLKSQNKVLAFCRALNTNIYVNAIGGVNLYSPTDFNDEGISLRFIKSRPIEYAQFKNDFCPGLSIIDVMMFNSVEVIQGYLGNYDLI
jgi:hypothetical protein